MYPTPLTYDLHNLHWQFMGFHDLILTSNFKRDSHSGISCGSISQIFLPKYETLSRLLCTILFGDILQKEYCRKL